jgi:hypothetical protein
MAVVFNKSSADRIAAATRRIENLSIDRGIIDDYPVPSDEEGLVIAKTTAVWNKGTTATLDRYTGKPGLETKAGTVTAFNRFATVQSGRWVGILGGYLIAAEC